MRKSAYSKQQQQLQEILVEARRQAGLTQAQVARPLHRPQLFVSQHERGERRLEVVEFLRIARLLRIDPHTVIDSLGRTSSQRLRRLPPVRAFDHLRSVSRGA